MDNAKHIWDFLYERIGNAYGVAGLMGNLKAESALNPKNLQNSYEKSLHMTDDEYTNCVDNGTYANFVHDAAGYGLAQWTYWTRKEKLLASAKARGVSIGDLDMQLEFLWTELQSYSAVLKVLKAAKSVREASDKVITSYERPADQSEAMKQRRAGYGQEYYNQFATGGETMNAREMREYAVQLMKSRKGKNTYTNGGDRKYFFGKPDNEVGNTTQHGWSDCSSACRAAIKAASGIDIGGNTDAQIRNRAKGLIVHQGDTPDESKLQPGDCLYFKGNKSHIMDVGHVEMYTGKNELYGHGSGEGPSKHNLKDYCNSRKKNGKGYFMAIRWILDGTPSNGVQSPTTTNASRPLTTKGDAGQYVKELQEMLIALGYSCGKYGADGEFGKGTLSAVKAFQMDNGLEVDGDVGALTWAKLDELTVGDDDENKEPPQVETPKATVTIGNGTWHVRTAPSSDAAKLGYVKTGDVLEASGETVSGWVGVMYNNEKAWVSAKGVVS